MTIDLDPSAFRTTEGADLTSDEFRTEAVLTDGGVYDNLGLETAFTRYQTILVSDAGQQTSPEADPKGDWARHAIRVLELVDNQVRSLRKRQLIEAYQRKNALRRTGAYWGIRSHFADFGVSDLLGCLQADPMPGREAPSERLGLQPREDPTQAVLGRQAVGQCGRRSG